MSSCYKYSQKKVFEIEGGRNIGILPSPLIPPIISSSNHKKQPPLLPIPHNYPFPVRTQNYDLVRGISCPPSYNKKNNSSAHASRKYSNSLSTTVKNLKQTTAAASSVNFNTNRGGGGGAGGGGGFSGVGSKKNIAVSPKLLEEIFILSPPPSSLPLPTFPILRPKIHCTGY